MNGVRVGKLGIAALLILLVAMVSGCAWRTDVVDCDEELPLVDCVDQAALDSLKYRLDDLEGRVAANTDAAAEAMMTADKALKCCRKEFVTIFAEEVYFAFNKFDLTEESKAKLDRVAAKLKEDPDYIIEIAGHTD
ncbi:MAG: OmpA family protein, partial [Planctomycetes bacterium]|nr:OmpA family protein [Planctomycetota bacterium]